MISKQVNGRYALTRQAARTGAIKLGGIEHRTACGSVIQIDLQHIDGAVVGAVFHEVACIAFDDLEQVIRDWQFEHRMTDIDHRGIQLDGGHGGFGIPAAAKFSQRRCAQTQLNDTRGLVDE